MKKTDIRSYISVNTVILVILFTLCAVGFMLTGANSFVVCGFTAAIAFAIAVVLQTLRNMKEKPYTIVDRVGQVLAIAIVFCLLLSLPPHISSSSQWRYPFQKGLIDCYHNIKEPDFFPDVKGKVQGDYHFDYLPTILQGTGHYSIRFTADSETVKEYERQFSAAAKHTYSIDGNNTGSNFITADLVLPDNSTGTVDVYIDGSFFAGTDAKIYVLDSNYNWNHPHTSAVIIDTAGGKVQFSREG